MGKCQGIAGSLCGSLSLAFKKGCLRGSYHLFKGVLKGFLSVFKAAVHGKNVGNCRQTLLLCGGRQAPFLYCSRLSEGKSPLLEGGCLRLSEGNDQEGV